MADNKVAKTEMNATLLDDCIVGLLWLVEMDVIPATGPEMWEVFMAIPVSRQHWDR